MALTKLDRCDSCGAAAVSRFVSQTNLSLLFCQHHTTKHELQLTAQGFVAVYSTELVSA